MNDLKKKKKKKKKKKITQSVSCSKLSRLHIYNTFVCHLQCKHKQMLRILGAGVMEAHH